MAKSQALVMAGRNCDDSVQILLCCTMTAFVMLPSARFLIGYGFLTCDNLQIVLGVPTTPQDF